MSTTTSTTAPTGPLDPVGTDLTRIVVANRNAGLHARPDDEQRRAALGGVLGDRRGHRPEHRDRTGVGRARVALLELGRDGGCDLCVEGIAVSRLHAIVEWDAGRARLEDLSTNGTLLKPKGGASVRLHHRGTSLDGQGELRLGAEAPEEHCARVSYRCLAK